MGLCGNHLARGLTGRGVRGRRLTGALGLLRSGTNLLAVQGLNRELHGNDFLIDLELHAGQPQPITAADAR